MFFVMNNIYNHIHQTHSSGCLWRQSDRNETQVRVKEVPHSVLKNRMSLSYDAERCFFCPMDREGKGHKRKQGYSWHPIPTHFL